MPRTIRREILDNILSNTIFPSKLLDVGGKKNNKRGSFNYPRLTNVIYLNIDKTTSPDIYGSVLNLPFLDEEIPSISCFEVLEHVEEPEKALVELQRVLKKKGTLYLSIPFLVGIHADPYDYQRWTIHKAAKEFRKNGLVIKKSYYMGGVSSVIHDILHQYFVSKNTFFSIIAYRVLNIFRFFLYKSPEEVNTKKNTPKITTGYFFELVKE